MPTYHYKCRNCSHEFEEFQRISDNPLISCPACKDNALKRIIGSGAGLIFKGSGFYLTDYKKNNSSPTVETGEQTKTEQKTNANKDTTTKSVSTETSASELKK